MRENGTLILCDPQSGDALSSFPTLQCVHCGRHWVVQPGSGRVRGYCAKCNGPFCGPNCEACVPQEQQLENIEQGRPVLHRPTVVALPGLQVPRPSSEGSSS